MENNENQTPPAELLAWWDESSNKQSEINYKDNEESAVNYNPDPQPSIVAPQLQIGPQTQVAPQLQIAHHPQVAPKRQPTKQEFSEAFIFLIMAIFFISMAKSFVSFVSHLAHPFI